MPDPPLSQADLEAALRAAAEALQDASETFDEQGNQVAASEMHREHRAALAALSAPEGEKPVAQVGAGLSGPPLGPQPFPVEFQPDQVPGGPLREAECVVMDALTMLPPEQARKLVESSSYQAFVAGVRASRSAPEPDQVEAVARAIWESVNRSMPEWRSVDWTFWEDEARAAIAAYEGSRSGSVGEDIVTPAEVIAEVDRVARLPVSQIPYRSKHGEGIQSLHVSDDQIVDLPAGEDQLLEDKVKASNRSMEVFRAMLEDENAHIEDAVRTAMVAYHAALSCVPAGGEDQRLTPDQWKVVLDAATSYDRRLPQGQGSPEIEAVLRALAGSVGEPE